MNDSSAANLIYPIASPSRLPKTMSRSAGNRNGQSIKLPPNPPVICRPEPHKKLVRSPVSSYESHSSFASSTLPKSLSSNSRQASKLNQLIEEHYESIQESEKRYCYYIDDRSIGIEADKRLAQALDGTYFVRKAESAEQTSNTQYILHFVCHNEIVRVPICYDKNSRTCWFLSGYGLGSEVRREYTGVDLLIQDKTENIFHELQYPFKICLYRPIDPELVKCTPLPDEVRILDRQNTILHDIAIKGLSQDFNGIIRISKDDNHKLRDQAQFILNKINGRNQRGQTPLIVAIQAKKYDFIELLLDNKVDVNMTDAQGCSPLHHVCRQANPKLLQKLIDRGADPHYFNRRKTTDGNHQSDLSAFHYLAMSKGASEKNIFQCARYLLEHACSLMPLTKQGKSPFDIAKLYNSHAYDSVKILCDRYQFNNIIPIEVTSRNEAKTMLHDLACPNALGKLRLRLKGCDNRQCIGNDGLFLLYKTRGTKDQPHEEYGICVHYNGQVFIYIISQKYKCCILNPSNSSWESIYNYSLITGQQVKDDYIQVILFKSREELVYNHTKHKGILPITLKDFVRKEQSELTIMKTTDLLLPNDSLAGMIVDKGYESDDDDFDENHDVTSIDRLNLSQIRSVEIMEENQRRLIWRAKVDNSIKGSFSIIIKDYLPTKDIDSYKQYRINEFNGLPRQRSNNTNEDIQYEFSPRSCDESKHESKLLLNELKNHPFVVHTFICNGRSKRDLRIFMEYLPRRDLCSYLRQQDSDSSDSLSNAFHWIYQLAQVMAYLSKAKIVHRDLAARNILLKNEKHIKLSDFGLSRFEGMKLEGEDCVVPSRWAAPECFDRNATITSSSDVWSFGIVIWEIFSFGATPYEGETRSSSQPLIRLLKRFLIEQNRRLPRPECCSEGVYDLICRCWNGNASRRPRFVDIVNEFNGMSIVKDCIVPFSRDERGTWKEARDEYSLINGSSQDFPDNGPEYVKVEDAENNDDSIVTML